MIEWRRAEPRCPGCGLVMTWRENDEQGACNECFGWRRRDVYDWEKEGSL